jgi:hypothetical protein
MKQRMLEMLSLPVCDHIDLDILQVGNKSVVEKYLTEGAYSYEMYFFCQFVSSKDVALQGVVLFFSIF